MFGSTELIVIALIIFILFGAAAIPKFAKSLGQAKHEFDKGLKTDASDSDKDDQAKNTKETTKKKA